MSDLFHRNIEHSIQVSQKFHQQAQQNNHTERDQVRFHDNDIQRLAMDTALERVHQHSQQQIDFREKSSAQRQKKGLSVAVLLEKQKPSIHSYD